MMKSKVIAIDLDGTLCSEEKTFEKALAKPIKGAVETLKNYSASGHTIIIWTARGWEQFRMTKHWLDQNEIPYDQIIMGKPIVDIFIDDRAHRFAGWEKDYLGA
jgi:uncharacterized HAD superfamily protein